MFCELVLTEFEEVLKLLCRGLLTLREPDSSSVTTKPSFGFLQANKQLFHSRLLWNVHIQALHAEGTYITCRIPNCKGK